MPGTLSPIPWLSFFDGNGNPYAGAKLFVYAAGTTTKINTYSDVNLTTPNPNPITLDSAGRTPNAVYLSPQVAYKFVLAPATDTDPPTSPIRTQDLISSIPISTVDLDVSAIAGEAPALNDLLYVSDGSGGLTAGRWYKASAANQYSSSGAGTLAFATAVALAGATTTVRRMGRVTGLAGLVAGGAYYVSATPGQLTITAPVNARLVGIADSTTSLILVDSQASGLEPQSDFGLCEGRLTLTTAVPVTTADVSAAGNRIGLYDGTRWSVHAFTERSLALVATSGVNYDVFLWNNGGTLTLELTAWASDTARATAIVLQDGVYVKTGATTRRYLGTIRASGANVCEDSLTKRFVWNMYNRMPRVLRRLETTGSWAYNVATYRQANAAPANQLEIVNGLVEQPHEVDIKASMEAATNSFTAVGIGQNSTSAVAAGCIQQTPRHSTTSTPIPASASLRIFPALGYSFFAWLEWSTAVATTTWYGDNNASETQSGIFGSWMA